MKKPLVAPAIICIAAIGLVLSCKKTTYPAYVPPVTTPPTTVTIKPSLNQLFAGLRSTPQRISLTAGQDIIVYGASGTMLHFYPNSFKNADGSIITSGTINLQLIEMYKAGDMIANRATTMANGQILQSGGQISIVATNSAGGQVFANKYGIGFVHSNYASTPMALFYGATTNGDSTTTWTQSDTTKKGTKAVGTVQDSVGGSGHSSGLTSYFYFDTCTSFSWANCDWFYGNDSIKTTVSAILPDTTFNATNTQLYLVLQNINTFNNPGDKYKAVLSNAEKNLGSGSYTVATKTLNLISEGQTAIVPAGSQYQLIIIANKNGTYYYYQQTGTMPHNGLVATATLTSDSQADIIAKLQAL